MLNGRTQGENSFTFLKPQGESVVDYFITYIDTIKQATHMYVKSVRDVLEEMKVIPTSTVPDHSMLILDVNLSEYDMISYEYRSCNTAVKYKDKKYNVNSIPENFMTQGPVVNHDIVNVIKDMSLKEPSQGSINEIYKEFVDIHIKEINRKLPTIKSTNNPHKKSKSLWTHS